MSCQTAANSTLCPVLPSSGPARSCRPPDFYLSGSPSIHTTGNGGCL